MSHEHAWNRLPDLLLDRDDPDLLAHVAGCHECQRQLFRLERVDRLLRETATAERTPASRHRRRRLPLAAVGAVALVAAASMLVVVPGKRAEDYAMTLHAPSGQTVGHARLSPADRRNVSVLLETTGLPTRRGYTYLLWAQDATTSKRWLVGRFMVSPAGACRASFNLPADRHWHRLWVTPPAQPQTVVAET